MPHVVRFGSAARGGSVAAGARAVATTRQPILPNSSRSPALNAASPTICLPFSTVATSSLSGRARLTPSSPINSQ
jgi:hypothetical protein